MKNLKISYVLIILGLLVSCKNQKEIEHISSAQIHVNSLGYLPTSVKKATIVADSCTTFIIKNIKGKSVYEGNVSGPLYQEDINQSVWIVDFSEVNKPGRYYIEVPEIGKSIVFPINNNVYESAYYTAMRGFYLWRCGTAVKGEHNGYTYEHGACHMDDGWLDYTEFGHSHKDGVGGWHDAGDHGKYVVNAGITVANLLRAWKYFQPTLEKISLNLPENTAPEMPDFLKEIKWETDFLLKMEFPDNSGRVSHKLTPLYFSAMTLPDVDSSTRYFSDWGTTATATYVAVMAMASRSFEPYNKEFATTCLQAAEHSYEFLLKFKDYIPWNQSEFWTGTYRTNDKQARLWAAAELWETTGEEKYLQDFEERAFRFNKKIDLDWDWSDVKNLGMFTYLLSERKGKSEILVDEIKTALKINTEIIVINTLNNAYGRPFNKYYWGCNGTVARLSENLFVANKLDKNQKYLDARQAITDHLFGRNYYNRSYVTGLGINPPMRPHDRRSAADTTKPPWPGYLVGGGHTATDWVDKTESYSRNEIAINWQSALVFNLAWAISEN